MTDSALAAAHVSDYERLGFSFPLRVMERAEALALAERVEACFVVGDEPVPSPELVIDRV